VVERFLSLMFHFCSMFDIFIKRLTNSFASLYISCEMAKQNWDLVCCRVGYK